MRTRRWALLALGGLLVLAAPAEPAFAQSAPTLTTPPTINPGPTTTTTAPINGGTTKSAGSLPLSSTTPTLATVPFPLPTTPSSTVPPAVPPHCYPETYPPAGSPANGPSQPYEIPVTAVISGGEFSVTGTKGGVLQMGPQYSMYASLCGLVTLPSQAGVIAPNGPPPSVPGNEYYNNNLDFKNPISVAVELPGIPLVLLQGYGASMGVTNAQIETSPAPNGGLNVDLYGSAKSTANFDQNALTGLLPAGPGECSVAIGDLEQDGLTPAQVAALGPPPAGTYYTGPKSLVHFTTGLSHFPGSPYGLEGQPVTGPVTNGTSVAVSNDFPVAPITPDMPPVPNAPNANTPPSKLCSSQVAQALNTLIGLPAPPGNNWFSAPTTFAIAVCGETNPNPPHQRLVPTCPTAPPGF